MSTSNPHYCLGPWSTTAAGRAQLAALRQLTGKDHVARTHASTGAGEGHLAPGLLQWEERDLLPPVWVTRPRDGRAAFEMDVPTLGGQGAAGRQDESTQPLLSTRGEKQILAGKGTRFD